MSENKQLYVVGNLVGGVGKTEISALIFTTLDKQLGGFENIEYGDIDNAKRLSKIIKQKNPIAQIDATMKDPSGWAQEALDNQYNPCVNLTESDFGVLDLGANVAGSWLDWAKRTNFLEEAQDEDMGITIVAVSSTDDHAFGHATNFIRSAYNVFKKSANYVLVINDLKGGAKLDPASDPQMSGHINLLMEGTEKSPKIPDLTVITIDNCPPCSSVKFSQSPAGRGASIFELNDTLLAMREKVKNKNGDWGASDTFEAGLADHLKLDAKQTFKEKGIEIKSQIAYVSAWIEKSQAAIVNGLRLKNLQKELVETDA